MSLPVIDKVKIPSLNPCNKKTFFKKAFLISSLILSILASTALTIIAVVFNIPILILGIAFFLFLVILSSIFLKKTTSKILFLPQPTTSKFNNQKIFTNTSLNEKQNCNFTDSALNDLIKKTLKPISLLDQFFIINGSNTKFLSTKGSIEIPTNNSDINTTCSMAIVNAANGHFLLGGAGTNKAISLAVTEKSWNSSKTNDGLLQEGQVSFGHWEYKDLSLKKRYPYVKYLVQAHGVNMSLKKTASSLQQAASILTSTYINIFQECESRNISQIQLPLISSGVYASKNKNWPTLCKIALLKALSTFSFQKIKLIILVNYNQIQKFYN